MSEHERFVRQTLSKASYRSPVATRKDVLDTINHYKGLKPVADVFVFNNGSSQKNLLALKGTIPVKYKGAVYHIPIIIGLLDTHPYNAPLVYVNPTPDMRITVSPHVDHNGKVYHPYLHDWKHSSSQLLDLIQVLIITFQEIPPVYAVLMHQQQQAAPYPTQPYPPYPSSVSQMPMPMPGMPMPGMPQPVSQVSTISSFNIRPLSLISAAEQKLSRQLELLEVHEKLEGTGATEASTSAGGSCSLTSSTTLSQESLKSFITKNISKLTDCTTVSATLLILYLQNQIITDEMKEDIEGKVGNKKKADYLYTLLSRCPETKIILIKSGLKDSLNDKAVAIFDEFQHL